MNNAERLARVKVAHEVLSRVFSDMCNNFKYEEDDGTVDLIHEALRNVLSAQEKLMKREGIV